MKFQPNFFKKQSFSSFFGRKFTLFSNLTMNFDVKFQQYENIFPFSISLLLLISLPNCIMVRHSSNGLSASVIPPSYSKGSHQINLYLRKTKSGGLDQTLLNKYYLLPTHRDPIEWTHILGKPNQGVWSILYDARNIVQTNAAFSLPKLTHISGKPNQGVWSISFDARISYVANCRSW